MTCLGKPRSPANVLASNNKLPDTDESSVSGIALFSEVRIRTIDKVWVDDNGVPDSNA